MSHTPADVRAMIDHVNSLSDATAKKTAVFEFITRLVAENVAEAHGLAVAAGLSDVEARAVLASFEHTKHVLHGMKDELIPIDLS